MRREAFLYAIFFGFIMTITAIAIANCNSYSGSLNYLNTKGNYYIKGDTLKYLPHDRTLSSEELDRLEVLSNEMVIQIP